MLLDVGEIVWVDLDPTEGTEQSGQRPALVLTDLAYHKRSPRALIAPITSNMHPWPFNVALPGTVRTRGVVMVDQTRMIHRDRRVLRRIERVPADVVVQVRRTLASLIGLSLQQL